MISPHTLAINTGESRANDPVNGAFFCILPPKTPWWRRTSSAAVEDALGPVSASYSSSLVEELGEELALSGLTRALSAPHYTPTVVYAGGGVTIRPGFLCSHDSLLPNMPCVYEDHEKQRVAVFSGQLSSLSHPCHPYHGSPYHASPPAKLQHTVSTHSSNSGPSEGTPSLRHWASFRAPSHTMKLDIPPHSDLAPDESQGEQWQPQGSPGMSTAQALLQMYDRGGPGQELLMLSELQGTFALVILDAAKGQVLAARDATGAEELYYAYTDGEGLMFTNSLQEVPATGKAARVVWQAVPPGHYIRGREPKLIQFALTPSQLRERKKSLELGLSDEEVCFPPSKASSRSLLQRLARLSVELKSRHH